ncbi:hypothetical protein O6H91_12G066800 [Diphasiastrum complanatum]|uniref:Uncharacterized protein n=1 Tax=Diphasiastrum complanatum TaxID=34168 RepID=A0ACC2C3B8_DIPCM|nr:hypothetical protein O6H91_12G066800 [Diphasiastrum complanatum]
MHLPVSISAISLEVFCTQVYSFQKKNCVCFSSVVTFVAQLYLEQAFFLEKQHEQTFVVCGTTISGRTVLPRKAAYEQTFAVRENSGSASTRNSDQKHFSITIKAVVQNIEPKSR